MPDGILEYMNLERFYPIGTPGTPWTATEKREWCAAQSIERSYTDEVLTPLRAIEESFDVFSYGALPIDENRYPLMGVRIESTSPDAPWALITGGVHGYETSGVQGALAFLADHAHSYRDRVNLLVAPCVSPWGYEVINRWNPNAVDPNRSFRVDSPSEEATAVMSMVANSGVEFLMHLDLHETTDTDESEFRPALAARDGEVFEPGTIPDGFYVVGDTPNPQPEFQAAIINAVETITHIAPADEAGLLIGSPATQRGVINYDFAALGLCPSMTKAPYTSTSEVYPDSKSATPQNCIDAQVVAVQAALDFIL